MEKLAKAAEILPICDLSTFCRRRYELVSKFKIGSKTSLQQGLLELFINSKELSAGGAFFFSGLTG